MMKNSLLAGVLIAGALSPSAFAEEKVVAEKLNQQQEDAKKKKRALAAAYAQKLRKDVGKVEVLKGVDVKPFENTGKDTTVGHFEQERQLYLDKALYASIPKNLKPETLKELKDLLVPYSKVSVGYLRRNGELSDRDYRDMIAKMNKLTKGSLFSQAVKMHYTVFCSKGGYHEQLDKVVNHPDFKKLSCYLRLRLLSSYVLEDIEHRVDEVLKQRTIAAAECFSDKEFQGDKYGRALSNYLVDGNLFKRGVLSPNRRVELDRILKHPNLKPEIAGYMNGVVCIREAWVARGNDYADSVTEEGWKVFGEKIAQARVHLERSYKIDSSAETAGFLISVTMADGKGDANKLLEAALSDIADDGGAVDRYMTSILPQWGGSLEEVTLLALRCAKTDRYDTLLPSYALNLMGKVLTEMGRSAQCMEKTMFSAMAVEIYQNYVITEKNPVILESHIEGLARAYWFNKEFAKSKEAFEAIELLEKDRNTPISKMGLPRAKWIKNAVNKAVK